MSARSRIAALGLTAAAALVMRWEGLEHQTYLDPVGVPTVCYGHTGPEVKLGQVFSQEACDQYLLEDLLVAARAVDRLIPELPTNTRNALISFTLNVGQGNLSRSTARQKFLAGDLAGGCRELGRWVYAKGVRLQGLVNRRAAETALCLKGPTA